MSVTLEQVEQLRAHAAVSYEEARRALEACDGDLLDALDLLVEQVGASQGVVALKEHYHAAVEALERELSRHPKLRIHRMGAFYPAGDEQVIVYEVCCCTYGVFTDFYVLLQE